MTTSDNNYSINYTPPTAGGGVNSVNNNIIIPGSNGESLSAPPSSNSNNDDEGIVITPDPSGIVIKTRLVKENQGHHFGNDTNESSYVPSSLASITSREVDTTNDGNKSDDIKIFLNIVSHPIIDKPAQRSGIDDETGKEVSGWRLPTSMGELRPTFDKGGNAAFAADCILNPEVVRRMNSDPSHFQFVCDLVIQCASKKFGVTLDRRFKTPRMKYAGYVDELTSLPIMAENDGGSTRKPTIAKQRVKGRKSAIVEEVESPSSVVNDDFSKKSLALISEVSSNETTTQAEFYIELFIVGNGDDSKCMPILDFLKLVADQDDLVPQGQPSTTLREMIRSPKLKDSNKESTLHESQLLVTPMQFDITTLLQSSSDLSWLDGGCSIIAKCSTQQSGSPTHLVDTPPAVELSAFLLVLSTKDVKTECILPFPVDTRQASKSHNNDTGVVEVRVPLLQMSINDGPDIGTEQWKIQNAFSGGGDKKKSGKETSTQDESTSSYQNTNTLDDDDDSDAFDESQPLAEDAFHAQDILSTHNLRMQEEERDSRNSRSRERVEYVG